MCSNRNLFHEYTEITDPAFSVQTANSNVRPTGKGTVRLILLRTDNSAIEGPLTEVIHFPRLDTNLLSGIRMHQNGVHIDGNTQTLRYQNQEELCEYSTNSTAMIVRTVAEPEAHSFLSMQDVPLVL